MATPPAPGFFKKVNYIVDFVIDPCHAPILVYIELARAPFGKLVLAWLTFGWDDVLRGYLRPTKAMRGARTFRRGKRPKGWGRIPGYLRKIPGIGDDVGNWIGKKIPGSKELQGRSVGQGQKFFWAADGLAQRFLLWWLIVDILSDFAYEWATLVDATEFCQARTDGSMYYTGNGLTISPHTGWGATGAPFEQWTEGPIVWFVTGGFATQRTWTCVSTYTAKNNGPNPLTHQIRLKVNYGSGPKIYLSEQNTIAPGAEATAIVIGSFSAPVGFTVEQRSIGGIAFGVDQDVWCFGSGR